MYCFGLGRLSFWFLVLQAGAVCPAEPASHANSFLQVALEVRVPNRSAKVGQDDRPETEHLVSLLLSAKEECVVKSSDLCLPILSDLRLAVWPHVQAETDCGEPWMPGWHLEKIVEPDIQSSSHFGNKTLFFRHVFKAGGMNTFANLQRATKDFRRLTLADFCQSFVSDPTHQIAFTVVREPISRFISGYSEIEYLTRSASKWPLFDSLANQMNKYEVGSEERAAFFFQQVLRNGIENEGHVRPQLDFFAVNNLPNGCSVPMGFIAKAESLTKDWTRMFALQNQSVPAYDEALAVHSHGERDSHGMESFLGLVSGSASDGSRYLRALCWLFLADYAIFEYELPTACMVEPMQDVVARFHKRSKAL